MNEKIAIEILKQANIETTVGCCEKCPRKDKNINCIGCLDDAKDILLNYIENLQSKIDKANEILNRPQFEYDNMPCNYEEDIQELKSVLKEKK